MTDQANDHLWPIKLGSPSFPFPLLHKAFSGGKPNSKSSQIPIKAVRKSSSILPASMEVLIQENAALVASFAMFLFVYVFGFCVVFRNWSPKCRSDATSCFLSLFHGTPAAIIAVRAIKQSPGAFSFASPNTNFQDLVLEYSMGYFLVDLLHYLLFHPRDVLFIAHHLATLYVFATCRYVVRYGAPAILVLLVMAEVTSACQNVWSLARFRKTDSLRGRWLFEFLSPRFYAFYSVCRGVLGPVFVCRMGVFYASGKADEVIPRWAWISWIVVIVSAILVSILWVWNHWMEWFGRRRRSKEQGKTG